MHWTAEDRRNFPVLVYDGTCGFCSKIVQLVLRHDRRGTVRFAPLEGHFGAALRARYPGLANAESVVWVDPTEPGDPERVLLRSDAALAVARYLGGWWRLALLGQLVPRTWRDALYRIVARHRHRLPGAQDRCLIPTSEQRARFLE